MTSEGDGDPDRDRDAGPNRSPGPDRDRDPDRSLGPDRDRDPDRSLGPDRAPSHLLRDVDLVVVALLVVGLLVTSFAPALSASPVRPVLAVLAVFLPGYALVAALFPRGPHAADERPGRAAARVRRLDGFDRSVLAATTGLVVTPLLGIAVHFSPAPVRKVPVLATVAGFVLVASAVAAYRRRRVPPVERYVPSRRWLRAVRGVVRRQRSTGFSLVTVAVAVAVLVAVGGVGAVVTSQETGERFTEFSLLGTADSGEPVAGSYPRAVEAGSPVTVTLGIENREAERRAYAVVPRLERVVGVDNETRIRDRERFAAVRVSVGAGRASRVEVAVTPTMTGDDLRLSYLLYRGDPPENVTTTNAYRRTHLRVTVRDGANASVSSTETESSTTAEAPTTAVSQH